MATIFGGQIPAKPNPWEQFGLGMGKGWQEEEERLQQMKQQGLAAAIRMYQVASPEDRAAMSKAPGWANILKMAKEFGIPTMMMSDGHVGFPVPEATAEQSKGREARAFPGLTENFAGSSTYNPLRPTVQYPPGVGGYEARQKALEAEATGERGYREATTRATEAKTSMLPARMEIERGKLALGSEELKVRRDQLLDETEKWKDYHKILRETLRMKQAPGVGASDEEKRWDAKYEDFSKKMSRYKDQLRVSDPMKIVDSTKLVDQMVGDYAALRSTLPAGHPDLIAAATDVASTLAYEITSKSFGGSELNQTRLQNMLDALQAMLTTPDFPQDRGMAILQLLGTAGFQIDEASKRFLPPKEERGWFDFLGG